MSNERKLDVGSKAGIYEIKQDEIEKMIRVANNRRDRLIIMLLVYTGCRRGELVLIRRMDVLIDRNIIHVPTIKRRGNPYENLRSVPIFNDKLKLELEAYLEITDIKFKPSGFSRLIQGKYKRDKDGIDVVRVNQIIAELAKKVNVVSPNPNRKHVHPHMFRHNFVRYARKYGLNFKAISQIIGHKSVATTMDLYGIPDEQELKSEAEKMREYVR